MGGIEIYKKTVMIPFSLFKNACGEQIGEQRGGEQITVLVCRLYKKIQNQLDLVINKITERNETTA